MRTSSFWLPIVFFGALIFAASQISDVPNIIPSLSMNTQLILGHLALYFCFGFFVARCLSVGLGLTAVSVLVFTTAVCAMFGITDEIHQRFVSGRNQEFDDLIADMVGGLSGSLIYLLWSRIMRDRQTLEWQSELHKGIVLTPTWAFLTLVMLVFLPPFIYSGVTVPIFEFLDTRVPVFSQLFTRAYFPHGQARSVSGLREETFSRVPQHASVLSKGETGSVQEEKSAGDFDRKAQEEFIRKYVGELFSQMKNEIGQKIKGELQQEVQKQVGRWADSERMISLIASAAKSLIQEQGLSELSESALREKITQQLARQTGSQTPHTTSKAQPQKAEDISSNTPPKDLSQWDALAVVTHPSNPVKQLSENDIRKLFTGECRNWTAVGGPDLAVQVIVIHRSSAVLKACLKETADMPLAPNATKLPYAGLIVADVGENLGAIGFVPITNEKQREFIENHQAVKKITIKNDPRAPAVNPSKNAAD